MFLFEKSSNHGASGNGRGCLSTEQAKELENCFKLSFCLTNEARECLTDKSKRPVVCFEKPVFTDLLRLFKWCLLRRKLLVQDGSLPECMDPSHEDEINHLHIKLTGMCKVDPKKKQGKSAKKSAKKRAKHVNNLVDHNGMISYPEIHYESGKGRKREILEFFRDDVHEQVTGDFISFRSEPKIDDLPDSFKDMEKHYKLMYEAHEGVKQMVLSSRTVPELCDHLKKYAVRADSVYLTVCELAKATVECINDRYEKRAKDRLMGRCLWLGIRVKILYNAYKKLQVFYEKHRAKKKQGKACKTPKSYGFSSSTKRNRTVSSGSLSEDEWKMSKKSPTHKVEDTKTATDTRTKKTTFSQLRDDSSDSEEDEEGLSDIFPKKKKKKKKKDMEEHNRDAREAPYKNLSDIERQFHSVVYNRYLDLPEHLKKVNVSDGSDLHRNVITMLCMEFARTMLPMLNFGSSAVQFCPMMYEQRGEMVLCELTGVFEKRIHGVSASVSTCGPVRKVCHLDGDDPSTHMFYRGYGEEGKAPPSSFFSFSREKLEFLGVTPDNIEMSFAKMAFIGYKHYTHLEQLRRSTNKNVKAMMRSRYEGMEISNKRIMFGWSRNHFLDRFVGVCFPYKAVECIQTGNSSIPESTSSTVIGDLFVYVAHDYNLHYQGMFDDAGMADGFGELRRLYNEPTEVLCSRNYHGMFKAGIPHGVGLWTGGEVSTPSFYLGVWEAGAFVHGLYIDGTDPWLKCVDDSWSEVGVNQVHALLTERWYWELRLRLIKMFDEQKPKRDEKLRSLFAQCSVLPFKSVAKGEHDRQMKQLRALCTLYREKTDGIFTIMEQVLTGCFNLLKEQHFEQNTEATGKLLVWNNSVGFKLEFITCNTLLGRTEPFVPLERRDLALLKIFLDKFGPNFVDDTFIGQEADWTPLHFAAAGGHTNAVELIAQCYDDADATIASVIGYTPVHLAAQEGHSDIVRLLVNKYDVDVTIESKTGVTPLHLAANQGHANVVTQLVKEYYADPMARNEDGITAMHFAALNGHTEVVKALVRCNADPMAQDDAGAIPVHFAASGGHTDVVELFAKEYKVDMTARSNTGFTLVHYAVRSGHEEMVKLLTKEYNADLMARDGNDWTPMHTAARNGKADMVTLLYTLSATIDIPDKEGRAPIHHAAGQGHLEAVTELYLCNADWSVRDNYGGTPIHHAAGRGHTDMVNLLAKYNVSVYETDDRGATPMHLAAQNGKANVVNLLAKEYHVSPAMSDKKGATPLHYAASQGHTDMVKFLVDEYHVDVNAVDLDGFTPLCFAANGGHGEVCDMLVKEYNASVPNHGLTGQMPDRLRSMLVTSAVLDRDGHRLRPENPKVNELVEVALYDSA